MKIIYKQTYFFKYFSFFPVLSTFSINEKTIKILLEENWKNRTGKHNIVP